MAARPALQKGVETRLMNILLVAAEIAPYSSKRPSAESVASLAKALRLLDHTVTVVVPRSSEYETSGLVPARRVSPLVETVDGREEQLAHVFDVGLASGVQLSLIDVLGLETPSDGLPEALPERAAWLSRWSRAVAALARHQAEQGQAFDVVHSHDCELGLALLSLKESGVARVSTVRDASYSGAFPRDLSAELGLSEEWLSSHGFTLGEEISLLKGALSQSDTVIVPSENYGDKLCTPELQGGLARAFQAVNRVAITEGVDQAVYNPATDAALSCRYDAARPEDKGRNRVQLLGRLELEFDPARPIVFCEHDPEGDPAWSTVLGAVPALMRNEVTLVLCGAEGIDDGLRRDFRAHLAAVESLDEKMRREVLAASDFYLSVRRSDPTGVGLMQASRYGAIPIAYQIDAVPDVVVDCDPELDTGNGFLFDSMTQRCVQTAVARAVRAYRAPAYGRLLSRVMRRDLAWDRAARRHIQVYSQLVSSR